MNPARHGVLTLLKSSCRFISIKIRFSPGIGKTEDRLQCIVKSVGNGTSCREGHLCLGNTATFQDADSRTSLFLSGPELPDQPV